MSWIGAIVTYASCWFLCLFMILPRGVPTQIEAGDIEPGTPGGAPAALPLRRKLIWTTLAALIPTGLFAANLQYGLITLADLDFLYPASYGEPPQ